MLVFFARDELGQQKLSLKLGEIAADEKYLSLMLVDAGENYFGVERLKKWADYVAHSEYWRSWDINLSSQNKLNTEEILQ